MKKFIVSIFTAISLFTLGVSAAESQADMPQAELSDTLMLMGQGMLGIFVVMLLIFLVIVVLNKVAKPKDKDDDKE